MGIKTAREYMESLNALSIVTYDEDAAHETAYHDRFRRYLAYVQENDLTCNGAMTDPKGDRALPPHRQKAPDLYLRMRDRPGWIKNRNWPDGCAESNRLTLNLSMAQRILKKKWRNKSDKAYPC